MANAHDSAHAHEDGAVHAHVSPVRFYWGILGILMVFTVITYALAFVELGAANLAVAIVIATLKASLVVLFFMHLYWDSKFNALIFIGSLLFLAVFLVYTVNDTGNRGRVDEDLSRDDRGRYSEAAGEWAPAFGPNVGQLVYASGQAHGEEGHSAETSQAAEPHAGEEPDETEAMDLRRPRARQGNRVRTPLARSNPHRARGLRPPQRRPSRRKLRRRPRLIQHPRKSPHPPQNLPASPPRSRQPLRRQHLQRRQRLRSRLR